MRHALKIFVARAASTHRLRRSARDDIRSLGAKMSHSPPRAGLSIGDRILPKDLQTQPVRFLARSAYVWQNPERAFTSRSIHRKIAPVEGKDRVDTLSIRQIDQRCIGELRLDVLIPLHYFGDCFGFGARQRKQDKEILADAAQKLLGSTSISTKKPNSFRDYRPAGKQGSRESPKHVHTNLVVLICAGKDGDQWAGVHEYPPHFGFPKFSK